MPLLLPFAYVLLRSFEVGWDRAIELVFRQRVWDLLTNTLLLLILVTTIAMTMGTISAFLLERYRILGKSFFRVSSTLPLCIPAFVSSFTWISLTFEMEGLLGATIVMTLASAPLTYLPVAATLRRMDRSLEEVSLSLGKSHSYTFWHAVFPQLKPALGSSFLLIALHMLVEFGAVSILNYPTFTTAIYQEYDMSFDNSTAALLALLLLIICLVVVAFEVFFRGQQTLTRSGKGVIHQQPPKCLPWYWHGLALIFFSGQFILSIGVPLAMLGYWMYIGTSLQYGLDWAEFFESLGMSLSVSAGGALATVIAAMPLVWCAIRYHSFLTTWIDRLPFLLHALPGIVIALALIHFSINYASPLYQTFFVLLLAYFMLYMPMAQTTLRASLEQVPANMENVGRSLGRSNPFVFRTLLVPSILPGIAAAFALVFLNLMKELTATLLLTPGAMQTLATSVWYYTNDASYAAAAPSAITLILCSGVPVYLLKKYAFN